MEAMEDGESLHEMGRAYGKPHNCIRCVLLPRGGIAPAARERSRLALPLPAHCRRRLIRGRWLSCGSMSRKRFLAKCPLAQPRGK